MEFKNGHIRVNLSRCPGAYHDYYSYPSHRLYIPLKGHSIIDIYHAKRYCQPDHSLIAHLQWDW